MKIEGHVYTRAAKEWSWSYSKLKNYRDCPKRMYEIDVLRNYKEEIKPGSPLEWGNRVHESVAAALRGVTPLPEEMGSLLQPWIDRVRSVPGKLYVEQKYAITRDFKAAEYFAPNVWYRGIGDVVVIGNPFTDKKTGLRCQLALILDWKTGKPIDNSEQLMLMAQCIFTHFPTVTHVRSEFIWLKDNCTTPEVFTRQEVASMWVGLLDDVNGLEQATKDLNFPPKPGGLCKSYCAVESCPYWKKGTPR